MRTLMNFDPVADFQNAVDSMERLFSSWNNQGAGSSNTAFAVPLDIFEQNNTLTFRFAIPGINPDDIDISIENSVLTIRGEMKNEWEETSDVKVYRREYRHGTFTRSVRLPENLQLDKVEASFENGFVIVSIPKHEPIKPQIKKIELRSSNQGQQALEARTGEPAEASRN